jgi:hypothetical protein
VACFEASLLVAVIGGAIGSASVYLAINQVLGPMFEQRIPGGLRQRRWLDFDRRVADERRWCARWG